MTVVSPEDWEEKFKPILSSNTDEEARLVELREKWGEPDEEGRGEFVLTRGDAEQPVSSNFNMKTTAKP